MTYEPDDIGRSPVELSIVMPCLNEAETLGLCLRKAFDFLARNGIEGEVVIGDNGSTDGSQAIATEAGESMKESEKEHRRPVPAP